MMSSLEALVVFARLPDPRNTKTRLCPPLSPEQAAALYACFLVDTLATARRVPEVERFLAFDPPEAAGEFKRLAPDFQGYSQQGVDLGERMHHAMGFLFQHGFQHVLLVGSDLPHLQPAVFQQGLLALRQGADVVLAPSADGGYYLVGLRQPQAELFTLPMSTPDVLRQTVERANRLGLHLAWLPENFDIDTAADLESLKALLASNPGIPARRTRRMLAHLPRSRADNH